MAGEEKGLPPARAGAEHADLAVVPGLGAEPRHGPFRVADDLGVGDAALGPHLGGHVVGFAFAGAVIEVVADRGVAVVGELARGFAVPFVPAGRMMDEHHAGEGPRPQGPRHIGRDGLVLVAWDRYRLRDHAFVGHCRTPLDAGLGAAANPAAGGSQGYHNEPRCC